MKVETKNGFFRFPRASELFHTVAEGELEPLVDTRAQTQLLRLAEQCPLPVQTACYECRLAERDQRVDLALCVVPYLQLSAEPVLSPFRSRALSEEAWQRSLDWLKRWMVPGSELAASVPFVWVAFDLNRETEELPDPCLGLCVDTEFFARRLDAAHSETALERAVPHELEELAEKSFVDLLGGHLPKATRLLLQRCLGSVELGVEYKHFSFMLGRVPATFKLDVRLDVQQVAAFLTRVGWPGPIEPLARRIQEPVQGRGQVQLNLVLHPELRAPLEVEYLTVTGQTDPSQRFAFLGRLVDEGLCSPAKAKVLHNCSVEPVRLHECDETRAVSRSWYVKVRFDGTGPSEAKAYLGLSKRMFPMLHR